MLEKLMRDASIWVVITDGATARICSSGDGSTTLIPTCSYAGNVADDGGDGFWHDAWPEGQTRASFAAGQPDGRHRFATELSNLLRDGAREGAYNGLIVVAAPRIMGELRHALAPETRALLIGEIVQDIPESGGPSTTETCH